MSSDSQAAARGAAPLALLPGSSKPAKSVTYVAGLKCYLCPRSLIARRLPHLARACKPRVKQRGLI